MKLKINKPHTRPWDERLISYDLIKPGGCFGSDLQIALPLWRITKVVRTRPQLWQRTRTCRPLAGSQSPKRRRTGGELQEPGSPFFAFSFFFFNFAPLPVWRIFRRARPCLYSPLLSVPEGFFWRRGGGNSTCRRADTPRHGCPEIRRQSHHQEPRSSAAHMGNFQARK